jgi:hypothetical protein
VINLPKEKLEKPEVELNSADFSALEISDESDDNTERSVTTIIRDLSKSTSKAEMAARFPHLRILQQQSSRRGISSVGSTPTESAEKPSFD